MRVVSVREAPVLRDRAIAYFQEKWASDESRPVYEDCIRRSLESDSLLPEWYLLMEEDEILGCVGLISNDFISRMDLSPWLCALYVEERARGRALGSLLIERVVRDAAEKGYPRLYLCSDHVGYYEKYGFERIATGYHPWGDTSGVFVRDTGRLDPRTALYAGSFDPPTLGHEDVIRRASRLFDRVIVAVMQNGEKKNLFTPGERVAMLEACVRDLPNVRVVSGDGLTVNLAREMGAGVLLRGVRGEGDADMEAQIAQANRQISGLETMAIFTDPAYGLLSSTIVRDVLKHGGPLEGMVPRSILADIYAKKG